MKTLLVVLILVPIVIYSQELSEEKLKKIAATVRTQPDSAILLLPPYCKHPSDSIKASAYLLLGNAWYFKSMYDSAISSFTTAAQLLAARYDSSGLSKAYNGIGLGYYFLSNYERSFEFHKKALEIREQIHDPQVSSSYNNLGLVLTDLGSKEMALSYYKKALQAKIDFRQFVALSTTLTNIGNMYRSRGDLDSAILYELKNLRHLDSIPDNRNLATCQNNLSISYLDSKKFSEAEKYALRALSLEKKLKREFEIINVCKNLSIIYEGKKQLGLSSVYIDSIFHFVQKPNTFRSIVSVYSQKARIDSMRGDLSSAYKNLGKYIKWKAHFDELERKEVVLELEKKYQSEIQNQEINRLQQENTIKDLEASSANQRQIFLVSGLLLLLVSIVVLYNRYQLKQRTSKVLDEKNTELQKLNGFKDRMFAVISHDLRNPVDAFNTIIESLNQNLQHASAEELKEFLASTLDSAKDLKSLLNNLLEWSLIQIGKLPFNPQSVALSNVVSESVSHIESMAVLKKIRITSTIGSEQVLADRSMITIIVRNLISNAIKFSDDGKSIHLHSFTQNGSVVFSVADEGIGMKPEELSKLFKQEENMRTIGSSSSKGAGIGLLLCKELADKNGGKIYAESEEGKGSTFYLELPNV